MGNDNFFRPDILEEIYPLDRQIEVPVNLFIDIEEQLVSETFNEGKIEREIRLFGLATYTNRGYSERKIKCAVIFALEKFQSAEHIKLKNGLYGDLMACNHVVNPEIKNELPEDSPPELEGCVVLNDDLFTRINESLMQQASSSEIKLRLSVGRIEKRENYLDILSYSFSFTRSHRL